MDQNLVLYFEKIRCNCKQNLQTVKPYLCYTVMLHWYYHEQYVTSDLSFPHWVIIQKILEHIKMLTSFDFRTTVGEPINHGADFAHTVTKKKLYPLKWVQNGYNKCMNSEFMHF